MTSYRPLHPPPGPPLPLAPTPQPGGNMYSQMWNYANYSVPPVNSNLNQQQQYASYPPIPQPPQPPPPVSQPAPPGQVYFPPSPYTQFNNQSLQPPPLPPSSPTPPPPPPPPSQPPPPPPSTVAVSATNQTKEHRTVNIKSDNKESAERKVSTERHAKPPVPARPTNKVETEDERRMRKKREMEKHRQQLKESQKNKPHGSVIGSHAGEKKAATSLTGQRVDNRLRKPTTFICKLKFRDGLPDTSAQPKLTSLRRDKDRAAKYAITSLEKVHKPQLHVEQDLGIPLDLLDLSVYNAPKDEILHIDPEDEKLLQEDISVTPIKRDGIKRKERPTDKGMSWLVKTQYISPLSTDATRESLSEKQAKRLKETRGHNLLHSFNSRERKIQDIEASFEACKTRPVHATNKKLQPVEILPLFPDFERWNDQYLVATFDGAPTADSESYNKMDTSVRDAHESQAIMKSFVTSASSSAKSDKFLAYMVPSVGELSKDVHDENEDISYTWVREYHWDVRGEDANDPTNYLVAFGDSDARYMPLPTKLMLRKKRGREGKTGDEVEYFPVPESVTVRQRSTVSVEMNEPESYVGSKGRNASSSYRDDGRMNMEDGEQKETEDEDDGDGDDDGEYDKSD